MSGLQCLKRLHLGSHHIELADPTPAGQQALFDFGTRLGELARERFPGGRFISNPAFEHSAAMEKTQEALDDSSVPFLYEAAFEFEGIRIRVDILIRNGDGTFSMVEVKSSTGGKPEHIPDIAIQIHVLEGSGLRIREAGLLHINNRYVYGGGDYDLESLFTLQASTQEARAFIAGGIGEQLDGMWEVVRQAEIPQIPIGPHCTKPYRCDFYGFCHQDEPEHGIDQLPGARAAFLGGLKAQGITEIGQIGDDYPGLTPMHRRVRDAVITGQIFTSDGLADVLKKATTPLFFLDFETFNPGLPRYAGTRPYQVIPFQWSAHVSNGVDGLEHREFLHENSTDPRRAFAESLLAAMEDQGSIVVYSAYEQTIIRGLAEEFPEHRERLEALQDRLFDLLKIVRNHFYHPEFHGSFSLKSVLPAMVPKLGYSDLEIRDGMMAQVAFEQVLDTPAGDPSREIIGGHLRDYCARDTMAMVEIFDALRQFV